jgi:hypothetical protein
MRFFSAGDWARRVTGKRFDTGELVKGEFKHRLPSGFQSYVLNTRKDKLKDVRVREALGLAVDYEWMNRQMFYNAYQRVQRPVRQHRLPGHRPAGPEELACWSPGAARCRTRCSARCTVPPRTDGDSSLRANLRKARELLKEAGWEVRDGVLRNARASLVLEYLDSNEAGARVVTPWMRNLEKLGIQLRFRPVDFALYQQRLQKFDFEITSLAYQGTHTRARSLPTSSAARPPTPKTRATCGRQEPGRGRHDGRMTSARPRPSCCRPAARWSASLPQPLPDPAVDGRHPPHCLQRLALALPATDAALRNRRSLGHRHLVGQVGMFAYILKRLLLMVPTLLGVLLVTFVVIQFVPGGPVEQYLAEAKAGAGGLGRRRRPELPRRAGGGPEAHRADQGAVRL